MTHKLRGSIAALVVGALALTSFPLASAQAASGKQPQASAATIDLSARKRHYYRRGGDSRAAMAMFGMVAGTIASIAAAEEARRYRERYGYGYYGGPPPYGYYGGPYYRW